MSKEQTPHEKATELIGDFGLDNTWGEIEIGQAIDSAIVCVKHLIKETPMYVGNLNPRWKFWTEVKKELEDYM